MLLVSGRRSGSGGLVQAASKRSKFGPTGQNRCCSKLWRTPSGYAGCGSRSEAHVLSGVEKLASHASKSTETQATSPGESPPRASAPTPTWSPTSAAAELVNYPTPEAAVGSLCGLRVSPPFADPPLTTQTMSRLNAILASCLTDPHPCVRAAELASFAVFSRPNTPHLGRFIPAMFMTRLLRVRPCSSIG
jgi:hypothetical protein